MELIKVEKSSVPSNLLKDRYIVPPFSVFNSITGTWQNRKDRWEHLGIDSAEGRDVKRNNAMPVNTFSARGKDAKEPERTSTFDPVLCEIAYKWFSREGDVILDPFAGGSVRGTVAGILGRKYFGIDLSRKQVEEDRKQYAEVCEKYKVDRDNVAYMCFDSLQALQTIEGPKFDMMFTCPPYYNLEKYSKDPKDLSNFPTYVEFILYMAHWVEELYRVMRDDTFSVIVVSEIRNPETGEFYGFVPDVASLFRGAGFKYYNEIILENNIGSLPIRAPKYFDQSRKIGRQHQNVLVFYKGNTKHIQEKFGKFEDITGSLGV